MTKSNTTPETQSNKSPNTIKSHNTNNLNNSKSVDSNSNTSNNINTTTNTTNINNDPNSIHSTEHQTHEEHVLIKEEVLKQRDLEKQFFKNRSLGIAALSAATAELITFPIDTSKIYLQLQPKDIRVTRKEVGISNFLHAMRTIYERHNIQGFFKGWKPAVLRASLNNALSATLYKPVRTLYGATDRNCPLWIKVASGFTTGSVTQVLAAPTDLLKVRLQADNARPVPRYKGLWDAIRQIYKKHGLLAFWRGLIPSMGRAGVAVASTFGTYDHAKAILLNNGFNDDFKTHTISSFMAGFVATTVACPLDVIKTRYQAQSLRNPTYKSPTDTFKQLIRKEGALTLWRGFWPMYSRLGPWQFIFFVTYEALSIRLVGESF